MSAGTARGPEAPARQGTPDVFLVDAIAFFLDAKRAGDRGKKTVDDCRKKLDLFQHWLRRTFGMWYLQDNPGQFVELAHLMGQSDLSQVMKYALSDAERARAGVGRL